MNRNSEAMARIRTFDVVIERDEDGWYIADVPAIQGCHTQGKTRREVIKNIKEAIQLCLEVQEERKQKLVNPSVSVQKVSIHA